MTVRPAGTAVVGVSSPGRVPPPRRSGFFFKPRNRRWKAVPLPRALALALLSAGITAPVHAACPFELSVYRDRDDVAGIDFRPTGNLAAVTNSFRMAMREGAVFEGFVMWTENPLRPHARITYQCPEGDVTGTEIDSCTVWEGAVYAIDRDGSIDVLPQEGSPAPFGLLFADLGFQMVGAAAFETLSLNRVPWDAFTLSGCQE